MKIKIENGKFATGTFFKVFVVGYTFGISVVFWSLSPLIIFASVFGESGEVWKALAGIVVVPFIAFLQALMFSLIPAFGLYAYDRIKGIEIVNDE